MEGLTADCGWRKIKIIETLQTTARNWTKVWSRWSVEHELINYTVQAKTSVVW